MRINHFFFLFLLLALAGCAGTPKWSDEEIAGIYVLGEVWQPGASGFLRPFLEVDGKGNGSPSKPTAAGSGRPAGRAKATACSSPPRRSFPRKSGWNEPMTDFRCCGWN